MIIVIYKYVIYKILYSSYRHNYNLVEGHNFYGVDR